METPQAPFLFSLRSMPTRFCFWFWFWFWLRLWLWLWSPRPFLLKETKKQGCGEGYFIFLLLSFLTNLWYLTYLLTIE